MTPPLILEAIPGPRCILGIDPGLHGALALFDPVSGGLLVEDVPTLKIKKAGQKALKEIVDERALARLVDNWSKYIAQVALELVGSMPGEGHAGAFAFGKTVGLLRGVCVASFLPIIDVTPATWKRSFKLSGDKDASRLCASNVLPRHADKWPLKKHDGRAEAALLAVYASRLGGAPANA